MSAASGLTKFLAVLLGLVSVPLTAAVVVASVLWLDGGSLSANPSGSVAVGASPRVDVHLAAGILEIDRGAPGRVVLTEHDTVHGLSRNAVEAVLHQLSGSIRSTSTGAAIDIPSGFPDFHLGFAAPTSQQRDVSIAVPPGASLHIDGGPAAIRLVDLSGPLDLSLAGGFVELKNFTVAGVTRLRMPGGAVAGSITMAGGSVDAVVLNGGFSLEVLNAAGTRLQASVTNGSVTLPATFGLAPLKQGSSSSVNGVIGGGAASGAGDLSLETVNGGIQLRSR